jgi:hypothetical protein
MSAPGFADEKSRCRQNGGKRRAPPKERAANTQAETGWSNRMGRERVIFNCWQVEIVWGDNGLVMRY